MLLPRREQQGRGGEAGREGDGGDRGFRDGEGEGGEVLTDNALYPSFDWWLPIVNLGVKRGG